MQVLVRSKQNLFDIIYQAPHKVGAKENTIQSTTHHCPAHIAGPSRSSSFSTSPHHSGVATVGQMVIDNICFTRKETSRMSNSLAGKSLTPETPWFGKRKKWTENSGPPLVSLWATTTNLQPKGFEAVSENWNPIGAVHRCHSCHNWNMFKWHNLDRHAISHHVWSFLWTTKKRKTCLSHSNLKKKAFVHLETKICTHQTTSPQCEPPANHVANPFSSGSKQACALWHAGSTCIFPCSLFFRMLFIGCSFAWKGYCDFVPFPLYRWNRTGRSKSLCLQWCWNRTF